MERAISVRAKAGTPAFCRLRRMARAAVCAGGVCLFASLYGAETALPAADRLAFANNLSRRGMYAEALAEYAVLEKDPAAKHDEVLFRMGEAKRLSGDAVGARKCYTDLLANHPASSWCDFARLDRALLFDGVAREKDLVALDRDDVPLAVRQSALYHLGEATQKACRPDDAATVYERAAALCATNGVGRLAHLRAAALNSISGDPQRRRRAMVAYYELSFASDERLAEEALYFAVLLSYREKRYTESAVLYRRLAEKFPDGARTRDAAPYAAWANHLAGKHAEALALARTEMERNPDSEDAAYLVAVSLRALERRDDALAAFRDALLRFPNGKYKDAEWVAELDLVAARGDSAAVLAMLDARGSVPLQAQDHAFVLGYEAAIAVTNAAKALEWARRAAASTNAAIASRATYVQGVLEARTGNSRGAVEIWTRLLTTRPGCAEAADCLYARAAEELRVGDFRAARRSFDDFVRRFPKKAGTPETLYWRGVAARGTEDAPEAEKLFRAALVAGLPPEFDREARLELGALMQKRGADREAAEIFSSLLETKAADRLGPASLVWLAESCLAASNAAPALAAAQLLEKRNVDATWNQIAAVLAGRVHEANGETDAARAAYARALACKARTDEAARAAYSLGRLESALGNFDAAKNHLSDAVERAHAENLLPVRARAYAALAANEDARGNRDEALRFYMLVGTLFDDAEIVPRSLARAVVLLREGKRTKEADELAAELKRRYPGEGR